MAKKTTGRKHKIRKIHSRRLVVDDQGASSFAGLSLVGQLAARLGIWSFAQKVLPVRGGTHERIDILKAGVAGLLSGSRGTAALEAVRQDEAMLRMMGIGSLPGEKGFWEDLAKLGEEQTLKGMHRLCARSARQVLKRLEPEDLQIEHGFIPLFGDGTLLEGSQRREGTKTIPEKGSGLMWGTWMFGPMLVGNHLCGEGEGEQRALFDTLGPVLDEVVDPLGLRSNALVLMDSLHGDGPSLERLEAERLMSIVGANKLDLVKTRLMELRRMRGRRFLNTNAARAFRMKKFAWCMSSTGNGAKNAGLLRNASGQRAKSSGTIAGCSVRSRPGTLGAAKKPIPTT